MEHRHGLMFTNISVTNLFGRVDCHWIRFAQDRQKQLILQRQRILRVRSGLRSNKVSRMVHLMLMQFGDWCSIENLLLNDPLAHYCLQVSGVHSTRKRHGGGRSFIRCYTFPVIVRSECAISGRVSSLSDVCGNSARV